MRTDIEERAVRLAEYIGEPRHRPRGREKFGVSKSTVHKDITERLETWTGALCGGAAAAGAQQGRAPHPRRPGHAAKIQGGVNVRGMAPTRGPFP